jgi:hypothetical protein
MLSIHIPTSSPIRWTYCSDIKAIFYRSFLTFSDIYFYTALCAELKPKEVFESVALQRFQKLLWTTSKAPQLYEYGFDII